jgi:hypothetical protein
VEMRIVRRRRRRMTMVTEVYPMGMTAIQTWEAMSMVETTQEIQNVMAMGLGGEVGEDIAGMKETVLVETVLAETETDATEHKDTRTVGKMVEVIAVKVIGVEEAIQMEIIRLMIIPLKTLRRNSEGRQASGMVQKGPFGANGCQWVVTKLQQ